MGIIIALHIYRSIVGLWQNIGRFLHKESAAVPEGTSCSPSPVVTVERGQQSSGSAAVAEATSCSPSPVIPVERGQQSSGYAAVAETTSCSPSPVIPVERGQQSYGSAAVPEATSCSPSPVIPVERGQQSSGSAAVAEATSRSPSPVERGHQSSGSADVAEATSRSPSPVLPVDRREQSSGSAGIPESTVAVSEGTSRSPISFAVESDIDSDLEDNADIVTDESDAGISVEHYDRFSETGKRSWRKDHCCLYCQKYISKMSRHLTDCHSLEDEVKATLSFPVKSKQRREKFEYLMCVGDYYHNIGVLETGCGKLIVLRRPTNEECIVRDIQPKHYTPCPGCLGFVKKTDLWRHASKCKDIDQDLKKIRSATQQASRLLVFQTTSKASPEYTREVVARMAADRVTEVASNDLLITQLGMFMFQQYGLSQRSLISNRIRMLSRLLIELRRSSGKCDLSLIHCISPDYMDSIIAAVQNICQIEIARCSRPTLKSSPSFALKIGHELRRCADLVRNMALKQHDMDMLQKAEAFLKVRQFEWPVMISSPALATLASRKQNRPCMLPCSSDLTMLMKYLKSSVLRLMSQLESSHNPRLFWHSLAELTVARIIIFNKRRSGEVARMTVDTYKQTPKWHESAMKEFHSVLTPLEKKLSERMQLVKIPAKRGSTAPVLLTPDMVSAVDLLIKYRHEVGVPEDNPYLFPNDNSDTCEPLRGHDCIRKAAVAATVQFPDRVTSTKLRKYMATVSQIFELREGEVDWLARHLSHDIRVHREYYRLHDSSVELAKISKLLLAVDNSKPGQWKGCKLDEIGVDMIGLSDHDVGLSDDSESENLPNTEMAADAAGILMQQPMSDVEPSDGDDHRSDNEENTNDSAKKLAIRGR